MAISNTDGISFGALVKGFRKRKYITQQHLAEALSVHRSTIIRWEQGDVLPGNRGIILELAKQLRLNDQETRALLEASVTALPPHWYVPFPRNPFFTGREEVLKDLYRRLGAEQMVAHPQSYALHGLGGVGKTQIALEYAYRHALEYSAVFWIGAETVESIISSLLSIADVLQLPERNDRDQQRAVAAVQQWLTAHRQWLVIWDNVEDLTLCDRFLPAVRNGAILLTTRHQTLGTLARGINLLPMEQDEGMLFLLRRAKVLDADAGIEQLRQLAVSMPDGYAATTALVADMGGLPLALDQAGAYLEETQCALRTYLELFRSRRTTLLQQRGERTRDHPASVSATFRLSIAAAAERHPAAWDFLRVCALLSPDAIPEDLFRQGVRHLGTQLEAACLDELEWNRLVAVVCSYSLLHRQAEGRTLSVHRLVQAVLLDTMTWTEREEWNRRIIRALAAVFPEVTYETWKQCECLLPHALACAAGLPDDEEQECLAEVLQRAADYLTQCAQYEQAEPLHQRVLRIREQHLGQDHPKVAHALYSLATLYCKRGELERAVPLCQRSLHIWEQSSGPEDPRVAEVLCTLAHIAHQQGKYEQAEPLFERVFHIWEQLRGPESPQVGTALNNLALLHYEQGKYEQAEQLYERAWRIWEQALGPEHHHVAYALNNLALLYWELGKYEQGESLCQQALCIWERTLGSEHPDLVYPLNNLARLYIGKGQYEQAEPLLERALCIAERAVGQEHPHVAATLDNLAQLYIEQGKDEQAEPLDQRALSIWEQVGGPAHPEVAVVLNNLARLYVKQEKYKHGEALCQRALSIWERAVGQEHPNVAFPLHTLAILSREQGKDAEAEPLFQRALHIREQRLGQHHPETAQTLHDLALFRQQQGKLSEALSFAQRALSIRSRFLGDTHPKTITTRALYGQLAQELVHISERGSASEQPTNRQAVSRTQERLPTPTMSVVVRGATERVAYTRSVKMREVTFTCTICGQTVTQLHYPSGRNKYCSESCRAVSATQRHKVRVDKQREKRQSERSARLRTQHEKKV